MHTLKFIITITFLLSLPPIAFAAGIDIKGKVTDYKTGEPVYGAALNIKDTGLWTMTDEKGRFSFNGILPGKYYIMTSCLGYEDQISDMTISGNNEIFLSVRLKLSTLALDHVTVTAERGKEGLNTSLTFGGTALQHLQMSNITDVTALLPGGKTVNPDLTANNVISLRDGGSQTGNAAFGTALEVDGVRIGNNASFSELSGTGTRNIPTENIESIEIITGVPSAEYGDLNSGMVKIHTKKGKTPLNITFAINPRTYQVSASKGLKLEKEHGFLNLSAEWTKATQKLSSPYTSYSRRGITVSYNNTFNGNLKFEIGFAGNIGGMNSRNDPDAYTGTFEKVRDNVLRGNTSLTCMLNKRWITNLKFDASVNFNDNRSKEHLFFSYASIQPSVHSAEHGYFIAEKLPLSYYTDKITDSKELDYAVSVKYEWFRRWGKMTSNLKAGVQWKASGNEGEGEYYINPALASSGYRPRPYSAYPFMHNIAAYIEENFTFPIGKTHLRISAGIRLENLIVKGTEYKKVSSFSPRFNAKWTFSENFSIRGGWGISEKLPSFYMLYPEQEYRDILTFSASHGESTSYVYYTQPYKMLYNPELRWQRNSNAEFGIETSFYGTTISLIGYYGKTSAPYRYTATYTPFSYNTYKLPVGFSMPADGKIEVDKNNGSVSVTDGNGNRTQMELSVTDRSFFQTQMADNGADIHRAGLELTIDFPEIHPISTRFRLDANYAYTYYTDETISWLYRTGWSHTSVKNRSYQYVGIYANGGNFASTANGKKTHSADANITAITHIPQARIIITCRLELSLLKRSRNLSTYKGKELAYNVSSENNAATGGSVYDGNSYTVQRPVAYMDLEGEIHEFTDANATNPEFANLLIRSANAFTFAQDGYGPYLSANLSVTKEIGDHVSLSFFANNFTNSRMYVTSKATGVSTIFTPAFYYGLTCKLKF